MKKTTLVLVLLTFLSACKKENKVESKPENDKTEKKVGLKQDLPLCNGPLIVIDKDVLTHEEMEEWENSNPYYCSLQLTAADSKTCTNYAVVDLSLVSDSTSVVATWLEDNTNLICYPASFPLIEKDHEVTDLSTITKIKTSITSGLNLHMTLKNMISKVANFNVLNYQRYINFSIDSTTKKPVFESDNRFNGSLYSFSVPSIKSIIAKYGIDPKNFDKFDIDLVKVSHPSGKDTIGFRITDGTIVAYYDYSTDPSGNPPHTLTNNIR